MAGSEVEWDPETFFFLFERVADAIRAGLMHRTVLGRCKMHIL